MSLTGLETVIEYGDKVTRVTDPVGITRSEYVDVLGQVVKITDNIKDGKPEAQFERIVETRKYEDNSSKVTATDVRGLETTTVSDVFGRVKEVVTPGRVRQVTEYDDIANTVSTGLVDGNGGLTDAPLVSTTTKDDTDKVVAETSTRADKVQVPESTTRYDGLGRVTEQVTQDLSTSVVLNPDGTPKTTTVTPAKPQEFTGEPVIAERDYNLLGASTKKTLTQASGGTRDGGTRVLDAAGQVVTETDQAGNTTVYEYTVDGLVALVHNQGTGVVTRNTYGPTTRAVTMTETVASDGTVTTTGFEYDPKTGNMVAVFNPANREGTQVGYVYDVFGNITQISYPDGKTIHHSFDENGRQTSSTDIAGNVTVYEYERAGLLSGVTQTSLEGTVLATVEYEYDAFGRMTKLSRGNGVTTRYTFTSADQIKTETTTQGDTVILDASYEYDTHGNLTKRVDTRQENPTPEQGTAKNIPPVTETSTYTYDAYNRLTESRVYDGTETVEEPRIRTSYQMNVSGDVTKESITTKNPEATTPTVSVREFEYNPLGHLTAITTDGARTEQQYDVTYTTNPSPKPVLTGPGLRAPTGPPVNAVPQQLFRVTHKTRAQPQTRVQEPKQQQCIGTGPPSSTTPTCSSHGRCLRG